MARTQLTGEQVNDGSIQRVDLDATTSGAAVIKKVIAGTNITISSTGVDAGTGDVTINATGGSTSTLYDIGCFIENTVGAGEIPWKFASPRGFTLPTNLAGSIAIAASAATAASVWSIQRIPSGSTTAATFATLSWAAAGTIPTLATTSTPTFAAGDIIQILCAASADATLGNVAITFLATHS